MTLNCHKDNMKPIDRDIIKNWKRALNHVEPNPYMVKRMGILDYLVLALIVVFVLWVIIEVARTIGFILMLLYLFTPLWFWIFITLVGLLFTAIIKYVD